MMRVYGILLLALFAMPGTSYRFVCNGFLANGMERIDECGVCDDANAARWASPNLAVLVDNQPLPRGISEQDWQTAVNMSFAAWEKVPGANLKFIQLDGNNPREFGGNELVHEIFWITDKAEWRRLVGSGEYGTLGATLPRYECAEETGAKRTIFDADLVLNGMSHINWQIDCQDDDCISIQTTLVHELGHFFGLDHPCLMCSSSIMSARAGFDLVDPVFDDMQGLRVLYPDNNRSGEFGFPCGTNDDCLAPNTCISDGNNRYCSTSCVNDGECSQGAICNNLGAKKACTFVDDDSAGGRSEGENCMRTPCSEPLVCAGASEPNFFCFSPCVTKAGCGVGEDCVKLVEGISLCVGIKNKGERCNHRELCEEELYCVFDNPYEGMCRAPCQPTTTNATGCAPGEQCRLMEARVEMCMPSEENLILDENADGFGSQAKDSGKNSAPPAVKEEEAGGCTSHNLRGGIDASLWLALLASALRLAWRRTAFRLQIPR